MDEESKESFSLKRVMRITAGVISFVISGPLFVLTFLAFIFAIIKILTCSGGFECGGFWVVGIWAFIIGSVLLVFVFLGAWLLFPTGIPFISRKEQTPEAGNSEATPTTE